MRLKRTTTQIPRIGMLASVAVMSLAGGWLGITVDPAEAAFPGKNGRIA